jgi:hypothetical protein
VISRIVVLLSNQNVVGVPGKRDNILFIRRCSVRQDKRDTPLIGEKIRFTPFSAGTPGNRQNKQTEQQWQERRNTRQRPLPILLKNSPGTLMRVCDSQERTPFAET